MLSPSVAASGWLQTHKTNGSDELEQIRVDFTHNLHA